MGHPEKPLDQLIEINPQVKLEKGVAYPFIPMEEISPGRRYVKEKSYRVAGGGAKFCHGDTLFARITPCLENGKIAQYVSTPSQIAFGSTEYWVFRSRKGISDPAYVFYLANSEIIRKPAEKSMVGASGRQRADIKAVENVSVPAPTLPIQRRIASILSAYDDLIENNTRRIAILEEMARRIYEEWFVHFRFPGHEKVKMVDSELGKIPEGWKVKKVDDTFEILGGGTPSKKEISYWADGTINWYSPTDLTRSGRTFMESSTEKITGLGLAKSSAKLFPPFSIMMTSRATIGVIAINTTAASTNQGFITCIPNDKFPPYLLFHWLKQNVGIFESLGTGATFKEIIKGVFRQIKLPIPSEKIVDMFQQTVSPMMEQILCFERKNANLRATRDFLLPKLISGEIDVAKLPEPEEAAA